ncbi:MAG: formate C-acetyltransferase/glycerol dehydratase family glycyl radical enzyme [Anaerolineae bacterium]|nr:formate C-acetyltransferase/glycerol dehydratase family glycyl radical enzyme [Anaerolineae bacterium]
MSVDNQQTRPETMTDAGLWSPTDTLSPRVCRLRDQYWDFYRRDYTNEVRAYSTGTPHDQCYTPWSWSNVPEMMIFFPGSKAYLLSSAETVRLPSGFWQEPLVVRRAIFFKRVVEEHLPVQILDGELVVGSHFSTAFSFTLTRSEAREFERLEKKFMAKVSWLDKVGIGNCGAVPGHLIPDYPRVLREGWRSIAEEADRVASSASATAERRALATAIKACAEGVHALAGRYAAKAARLAEREVDPTRGEELREIARICGKVPWEPAETFTEALQALWLTHMLVMVAESYPGPGVSPGRIDQYLYPYYQADLAAGRLTREQAREWLHCFWIKHNYAYDYQGWVGTNQGINSSFGQLITLGGIDAQGKDASNDLTYLMLDVIKDLNLLEPKPNVRLHRKTPERLLARVVDMVAEAQGSPFLLNFDEQSIAGLRWQGLPEAELWDYAPVGCLENTLQGDDRSGTVDLNLNLAKAVELALHNGSDAATGEQVGPATGDPRTFTTFDQFLDAVKGQTKAILDLLIEANNLADGGRARFGPTPYVSALVGGCLESGRDVTAGGARHNYLTVEGVALGTVADSLAAVKKLVYDDGAVSMDELVRALDANFEGYEALRQTLLHKAPKFGNDDDYADDLAREFSRYWTEEAFRRVAPDTGKRYRGGYLSWNYWVAYAPKTAATPDGRRRGQFLSNGVCPVNGADRLGPTAVIKSVGHLGLETVPNGASHTMSFSPGMLRTAENRKKLAALLRAYAHAGGTCLQINVVSPDTLRAAQHDPDAYRNLLVRVTGYNAYFVMLGKEIQDEIIARESHGL